MKLVKDQIESVTVIPVFEDDQDETVKGLKDLGLFDGKVDAKYAMLDEKGHGRIYYGLGERLDINPYKHTHYFHNLGKYLQSLKINEIHLILSKFIVETPELLGKSFEGLYQAEYIFDTYKTGDKEDRELTLSVNDYEGMQETFDTVEKVSKGIFTARNLVNQPANELYPETLSDYVQDLFKDRPVEVEVLGPEQIEAAGMDAYLAVSKGSDQEPRFIVIKYFPTEAEDHLTLVGKGVTYDSGGYAIKPGKSMKTMKSDMAGAAAVVGAIQALADVGIQQNVVGVIAATENLINGSAMKNGDIISSMKGTTIEVNNTDAEGRLTLADAIYYAATQLKSTAIVDLATLTGAAIVALGNHTTALMSNNDELAEQIITASERGAEPTYPLKAFPSHYKQIKGKFADLNNAPEGGAGTITAGLFLEHFTEDIPWVHLDIAGPSYSETGHDYLPAGASGTGVKTLYRWIAAL